MSRVLTNNVGLAQAQRPNFTTPGAVWSQLEPNTITRFGGEPTLTARSPIRPNRLEQRGVITDLEAGVEYEEDLTYDALRNIIEGFVFATMENKDMSGIQPSAVVPGAYTVADLDRGIAANSLLWASGFSTAANNGLKVLGTAYADGDLALTVGAQVAPLESIVAEGSPPSRARVSFTGYRVPNTGLAWAYVAANREGTLTQTGLGAILITLGLLPGALVHFGSIAARGDDVARGLVNATDALTGYARVKSVAADTIVFDRLGDGLRDDMASPTAPLDLLFGEFVRNVPVDNADYLERSYDFEASFPDLGDGTAITSTTDAYEYVDNCYCNTLALGLPLTNKVTMTLGFLGVGANAPGTVRRNAMIARTPPARNDAVNTSNDYARLRISNADETGLSIDFKDMTLTLSNNVTGDKIQGVLGNKYINFGLFNAVVEGTMLFTSPEVIRSILENTPGISMELILKGRDGVIGFDLPQLSLSGGAREFPVGEAVQVSLNARAVEDPDLGTAIGVSLIPVPLPDSEID